MTKLKFIAKVISLGRITIPEEIREILSIQDGDIVEAEIRKIEKKEGERA